MSGRRWAGPLAGWQRSMWSTLPLDKQPTALLIICEGPRLEGYMLTLSRARPVGSVCPPKAPPSYRLYVALFSYQKIVSLVGGMIHS